MILHIFNNQVKFSVKYFEFLKDNNEDFSRHKLFHYGRENSFYENLKELDSRFCNKFWNPIPHMWLYKQMKSADKIIVHSLASPFLLLMLLFNKDLLKKIYWVIWGKDLYIHRDAKGLNLPYKIYDAIRKPVIKRISHIITFVDGDYDLAVDWYGMNPKREDMTKVCYPYSVDVTGADASCENPQMNILLGNSGSKTNNHLAAMDILKKVDDGKMEIYSPLSYGGSKFYVKKVIARGKELFGRRYHPISGFMEYNDYMKMLNSIDVAFFFHDRQEALNNTISLIAKKKTVYIRSDVTSWRFFVQNGICVRDSQKIGDQLTRLSHKELDANVENIRNIWDPEFTYMQWRKIFD